MQKVQADLDPHLLEEAHHRLAGAAPALVDVDNCVDQEAGALSRHQRPARQAKSIPAHSNPLRWTSVCRDIYFVVKGIYYPSRV